MAAKVLTLDWSETGLTVYCIVRREADSFRLDDADGSFTAAPADPYLSLAEDAVIKGRYEVSESRTVWDDGEYTVTIYRQVGGSPVPASDITIGTGRLFVLSDAEIVLDVGSVSAVWDRELTGATHNIPTSAGRRLRQVGGIVMTDGTAQAGGVNTITLAAGESAIDRIYWQSYVAIVDGTGAGQGHHIITYNGTTKVAVIDDNWTVQPDDTSEYVIYGSGSHDEYESGLAQAGSNNTITLESTAEATDGVLVDSFIDIVSGTGDHQTRRITAYDGTTKIATVTPNWTTNPDATSGYWIHGQGYPNVWDEVLSKTTHNEGQSSGKRLRQLGDLIAEDASINDATPTDTSFITTLTSTVDDLYVDEVLVITNDTSLTGQSRVILAYDGTTKRITVDEPFSLVPINGSDFIIFTPHVHPVTQIAEAVRDLELEGGLSWGEITKIMAAALAGKLSGGGTATLNFTSLDGATTRIITTRDNSGNRTQQILDGT